MTVTIPAQKFDSNERTLYKDISFPINEYWNFESDVTGQPINAPNALVFLASTDVNDANS